MGKEITALEKKKVRPSQQYVRKTDRVYKTPTGRPTTYKPEYCEDCGKVPPRDLANISQEYKRDINDFEWLCRKCHMTKDGRLNQLGRKKIYEKMISFFIGI